jgi:hypothetical protein
MTRHGLVAGLVALALVGVLAGVARAEKKELSASQSWNGSIDDDKAAKDLLKEAPEGGYIADEKAFKKLWEAWKVTDKVPEVDFKKNIVLVATTVGSKLNLKAMLDTDKGDLVPLGLGTRDLRPGFRYVISVVPREGVKTVNGKELKSE